MLFALITILIFPGCATIGYRDVKIEKAIERKELYLGMGKDGAAKVVKFAPFWDKTYSSLDKNGERLECWILLGGPYRITSQSKGYTLYFKNDELVRWETWPPHSPPSECKW